MFMVTGNPGKVQKSVVPDIHTTLKVIKSKITVKYLLYTNHYKPLVTLKI